ncbi:hypothetical protein niasHT_019739 [Heterodera trifolii]|uniref:Uncharacterized protein n=1 Tax=Heterodera trifolii TaxID=157864 RepID=A0ABD2LDJ1_9BILA
MDVFNRLLPRPGNGNVQFKKLRHTSNSASIFASDEATGDKQHNDETTNNGMMPATNSPRVELGLVLSNNSAEMRHGQNSATEGNGKANGTGKQNKSFMEEKANGNGPSSEVTALSKGKSNGTAKGGGKRFLSALLPGKRKGRLGLSVSEPRLNFDIEPYKNDFEPTEIEGGENAKGGRIADHQQNFGERNRLCDGISDGSRKSRPNFAGALQKVREKLNVRPSSNSHRSSAFSPPMNRSNTTPTPFSSMRTPTHDKNIVRNTEERTATDVRQQQQEGAMLAKLRKQAKIMDIVGRKSNGNAGKNRKSDGQRLLLSEDGYCSGLE